MWELNHKEGWALNNWCFWTVGLRKTLESPLDLREIKPVSSKGWISTLNIHWKDWCWTWSSNILATWCNELTQWKRPWCWERLKAEGKGAAEDERVRYQLSGHKFEQTLKDTEEQGGLECYSPWGRKESDTAWWLNNNSRFIVLYSWNQHNVLKEKYFCCCCSC